ncbi:hypothetical protein [Cochlodiniinecator piscidefendens]|uniref:hypothetical protein n=1 Tax=Cochlodiniinecator piscidefendens TaxID=2715756 RepID=UPI0014095276|nr:hypothetical protein [Cochlodiniinecator piscidefendens]
MSNFNQVAVAVIHGMGSQGDERPDINALSFSKRLHDGIKRQLGVEVFDTNITWQEIFWADILQKPQSDYVSRGLKKSSRWLRAREFVMHSLTDAAAYRYSDGTSTVYQQIHQRVAEGIENLERKVGPSVPLIVLAHSLGGHVMSNYIYDLQKQNSIIPANTPFQRMETMAGFVTFGCNIPIFTFAYPYEDRTPISYPGFGILPSRRLAPWWLNYNDKDDALGMPLGPVSPKYEQLIYEGALEDHWVNVGNFSQFWNPMSHVGYWGDRGFHKQVAAFLHKGLEIGETS